nr:hypothetical protein [Nostoc sp. EkiNYC01]
MSQLDVAFAYGVTHLKLLAVRRLGTTHPTFKLINLITNYYALQSIHDR